MLPAILISLSPPSAASLFDSCFKAHAAMKSASVLLEVSQVLKGDPTRTSYDLKFILPEKFWLRAKEPEQGGRGASDRTFFLDGPQIYGYDAIVHEKLSRKTIPVGGLIQKFSLTVGQVDDAIACLLDAARLKAFLMPFRGVRNWSPVVSRSGLLRISRSAGSEAKANTTVFEFESSSRRLRRLEIGIPDGRLVWSLTYGPPPAKLSWRPPSSAAQVGSFTQRPPSARFLSSEAKRIAERSMFAYDRLRHARFRTEGTTGSIHAWISGGRIREESGPLAYVWDRRAASIRDSRTKTFYSGRAGTEGILNALAKLGSRMDPMVRQIATRQNPMRVMLVPGVQVQHMGSITLHGSAGDILEFQNLAARVSFVVRRDNGLLAFVRTETLDGSGSVVSLAEKSYIYGSVGKALDPALFQLTAPKGYSKAPIGSLTKG